MKAEIKELQKLKGVGEVLSRRLVEAGCDTFAKIVAAGEDGLKKIQGVNPKLVGAIIAQAVEMAGEILEENHKSKTEKIGELKQRVVCLRCQVQKVAFSVRDRFMDQVRGKNGKKVEQELVKMISTLEMVEAKLDDARMKRAGKVLTKAEKCLGDLTGAGIKNVGRGLKKARKSLKDVYA
ncbi:MAG: helix-hairpin-helix domain-containing protein [Desulfuromonadales bacterium]|nr:helix-hairpin-helix domain-containing protein [Desulfuromonadales bacterium]